MYKNKIDVHPEISRKYKSRTSRCINTHDRMYQDEKGCTSSNTKGVQQVMAVFIGIFQDEYLKQYSWRKTNYKRKMDVHVRIAGIS